MLKIEKYYDDILKVIVEIRSNYFNLDTDEIFATAVKEVAREKEKIYLLDATGICAWLKSEYKPVLTKKEKEYLKTVMNLIVDKPLHISKRKERLGMERIEIEYKGYSVCSPYFKHGERFNNMKSISKYTLEELEL